MAVDPVLRRLNGDCFWGVFIRKALYAQVWSNLDLALASIILENSSIRLPQERHYHLGTQVPVKHDQSLAHAIQTKNNELESKVWDPSRNYY